MQKRTWVLEDNFASLSDDLVMGVQRWNRKPESALAFLKTQGLTDKQITDSEKAIEFLEKH
jgi:hypothetical protein